jgi:hypothetical protein
MTRTIDTTHVPIPSGERPVDPSPRRASRRLGIAVWALAIGAAAGVGVLAIAVASGDSSPTEPEPAVVETSDTTALQDPLITRFGEPADDATLQDPLITRFGQ